jgi:hypothetical protein
MWLGTPTICVAPGKYKIAFGGMIQSHPKLTTGTVEFEVKPTSDTAWGKEVGGLQAGLGIAEKRAYHTGETVTLAVRVRNISKEVVKFRYLRQFFMENAPTVTDAEGKPVHFRYGVIDLSKIHVPVDVNLAPGKEIELYELKFKLKPASEGGGEKDTPFYGRGKFSIQYSQVFGNSSAGSIKPDPALSKLATGTLELEVTPAEKN